MAKSRAEKHAEQGLNDLEHYMASCSELSQEKAELQKRIKEFEQYIQYVEARAMDGEIPMCFEDWNDAVKELAKELAEVLKPELKDGK